MTKTGLEFGNLGPARRVGSPSEARTILVIVICLIFAICDLEFLVTSADCRKRGKSMQAPSGGSPKPAPLGPTFYSFRCALRLSL